MNLVSNTNFVELNDMDYNLINGGIDWKSVGGEVVTGLGGGIGGAGGAWIGAKVGAKAGAAVGGVAGAAIGAGIGAIIWTWND